MQPAKRAADAQKLARRLQGFVRLQTSIQSAPPLPFGRQSALPGVSARQQQRSLLHGAQQCSGNSRSLFGNLREKIGSAGRLRIVAIAAAGLIAVCVSGQAQAAAPAGCAALQEKYPDWKGKTLVNAINPHTPGYEAIDPKDPDKYVGFDIDLGEAIGECLGFKLTYKAGDVRRAADDAVERPGRHRDLRHLRHQGARQGGRLHHLFEGVRRRAGRQGQPEEDQRHQHLDVRRCGGREHRLRRGAAGPGHGAEVQGRGQARADAAALRQQRQLHPGDPRRPRRHLCQRRQYRRPGGEGQSRTSWKRRSR